MTKEGQAQQTAQWIEDNPRLAKILGWLVVIGGAAILAYVGWRAFENIRGGKAISTLLTIAALSLYFWGRLGQETIPSPPNE